MRAMEILQTVDTVLCEDTRTSKNLLNLLGIRAKNLQAYHEYNEAQTSKKIIEAIVNGKSFALISDAGTPLISDPGYVLVCECHKNKITVHPIPGPSSLTAVLSAAGVPTQPFTFFGFLSNRQVSRRKQLISAVELNHTSVFYEAPHRILSTIDDLIAIVPNMTNIVVAKELTKRFERFIVGSAVDIKQQFDENPDWVRGEFVIVIPSVAKQTDQLSEQGKSIALALAKEIGHTRAAKIVAKITNDNRNKLYTWMIERTTDDSS